MYPVHYVHCNNYKVKQKIQQCSFFVAQAINKNSNLLLVLKKHENVPSWKENYQ